MPKISIHCNFPFAITWSHATCTEFPELFIIECRPVFHAPYTKLTLQTGVSRPIYALLILSDVDDANDTVPSPKLLSAFSHLYPRIPFESFRLMGVPPLSQLPAMTVVFG